jgi:hypothetical protein
MAIVEGVIKGENSIVLFGSFDCMHGNIGMGKKISHWKISYTRKSIPVCRNYSAGPALVLIYLPSLSNRVRHPHPRRRTAGKMGNKVCPVLVRSVFW